MEWLKRLIRRLLGRKEPDISYRDIEGIHEQVKQFEARVRSPSSRGIQSTDLGMRKVARHGRRGRLHAQRSGFDPNKRMVDIEDGQTRTRKKKTWFEDRNKNG